MLRMTQSDLAESLGLSTITIKRIEKNDETVGNASLKTIKKIKKVFEDKGIEFLHPQNDDCVAGVGIKYHGTDKKIIKGCES